jgi:hypothetical protein
MAEDPQNLSLDELRGNLQEFALSFMETGVWDARRFYALEADANTRLTEKVSISVDGACA